MTTVGYEKIRNWAIKLLDNKTAFKKELLADQPEPPKYFAMMKKLNKISRPLVPEVPKLPHLTQNEWKQAVEINTIIIDTRNFQKYAQGYWPGSINIANTSAFATYMGWLIPYDQPFVLIGEENELEDMARKLMRIGLDQHLGYITPNDLHHWEKNNLKSYQPLTFNEVKNAVDGKTAEIIDVRGASDYKINHIPGAHHLFYGNIGAHLDQVPKDKPVIVHCQTGIRAAIAHSILLQKGFQNVSIYWGGMEEWMSKN